MIKGLKDGYPYYDDVLMVNGGGGIEFQGRPWDLMNFDVGSKYRLDLYKYNRHYTFTAHTHWLETGVDCPLNSSWLEKY